LTKIIGIMQVRNEAWILERTLKSLISFCDHILVADQRSTDATPEILRSFPAKLSIIDNSDKYYSERIRWRLLDLAREFDGNNLVFCIDADEIISSPILTGNYLDELAALPPGTSIAMEWINLWRHPLVWRHDASVWTGQLVTMGIRDDRQVGYRPCHSTEMHEPRLPKCPRQIISSDLKLLHYQFVLFERKRSKEAWYRALETIKLGIAQAHSINYYYRVARDEREVRLAPIDPGWIAGWQEMGIDLEHFAEEPLYWYDVEVLRWFAEKGPAYFAAIDLWDIDWEAKRRLALAQGFEGIPAPPIVDPRTWEQKAYHAYLARFQRHPFWREPRDLARLAALGLRRLAKGLGLQRHHLEHLGILKPKELGDGR
jgi:glycosyltransferase involved in cell wall biosynthesis